MSSPPGSCGQASPSGQDCSPLPRPQAAPCLSGVCAALPPSCPRATAELLALCHQRLSPRAGCLGEPSRLSHLLSSAASQGAGTATGCRVSTRSLRWPQALERPRSKQEPVCEAAVPQPGVVEQKAPRLLCQVPSCCGPGHGAVAVSTCLKGAVASPETSSPEEPCHVQGDLPQPTTADGQVMCDHLFL